ncbi:MAG TPA: hypothetical protein EYQ24_05290 [Bacteroidetes bacterium]|nr:hypothetical protein [Bacteroidota bacterium]
MDADGKLHLAGGVEDVEGDLALEGGVRGAVEAEDPALDAGLLEGAEARRGVRRYGDAVDVGDLHPPLR